MSYISEQLEHAERIAEKDEWLKPCPFCGSKNVGAETFKPFELVYWVECKVCGSSGSRTTSLDKAVDAWNRRV